MYNHEQCPNCESPDTECVHTEVFTDFIERVRICNNCPTEYVVDYGNPHVKDVTTYE